MRTIFWAWAAAAAIVSGVAPHAAAAPSERAEHADAGFLDISSDPPARILVDDADTGKVTPQPHLELEAGHHRLTLVTLDGAHKRTLGFNIEAGKTTRLSMHLAS